MKMMAGRFASYCAALLLVLGTVSAVQKIRSIEGLKKIDFGKSVPKHSLMLLHWFADIVKIDSNNVMRLTFDPNSDYGSHHYGNYERMLDPLPQGYRYYTVGNLNHDTSSELPDYVVNPRRGYGGENRDRIIIRVQEQRIDQVFITQHYETSEAQGTVYDPDHTYQITTNLLRQIREFSVRDNNMPLLHLRNRYPSNANEFNIRQIWGNLACLGLLLYMVIEEKQSPDQPNNRPENNRPANKNKPVNIDRPANYNRPQNNHRPANNNRPANYNRPQNNHRPANYNRPQENHRPVNYNRSEIYNMPVDYHSQDDNNRARCSRVCAIGICCTLILVGLGVGLLVCWLKGVF